MRVTGSRSYYQPAPPKMPPGVVELMEGLTREVLKHNPSDIYGFCAGHMQELLDKRDGPSIKKISLKEKVAKAQEKVRKRAAHRRQEFDKNVVLEPQNRSASSNIVTQELSEPKDFVIGLDKNNITVLEHNELPLNIINTPNHQEQILKDSPEMIISNDSNLKDVIIESTVINSDLNEEHNIHSKSVNAQHSDVYETISVMNSNHRTIDQVILKDISSDSKPIYTQAVSRELIEDVSISLPLTTPDQLNQNQKYDTVTTDVQNENSIENHEVTKDIPKESLPHDSTHNIPNDNVEKITKLDIKSDLPTSYIDKEKNLENVCDDEKPIVGDIQILNNIGNESISSQQAVNKMELFTHSENLRVSPRIEDKQLSVESTYLPSVSGTLKIDSPTNVPQVDNTERLQENHTDKNVTEKYDADVRPFNNTKDGDVPTDTQKATDDKEMKLSEVITQTPEMETHIILPLAGVDSDVRTLVTENSINDTHEVSDRENEALHHKAHTSLDNMFQPNEKHPNFQTVSNRDHTNQDNKDEVIITTDIVETNQNEITPAVTSPNLTELNSSNLTEKNPNENQGTKMDLETAAITIQKVFRNFLFKSRGSTFEDTTSDDIQFLDEDNKNKEESDFAISNALNTDRRAHGITRMDTVLQTVNEEKSLSLSTDDSSTLSSAATTIQAHVRGFLVRNKLGSNKTFSTNSLAASPSNEPSLTSIETGYDQNKNKTVLNIHIVPEGDNCLSRDESLITSIDLSLDSSPPSSINLHPLGYDKSERRKQLKREDAIQSVSPPSNNSGKLSEDFDTVKQLSLNDQEITDHPTENSVTLSEKLNRDSDKNAPSDKGLSHANLKTGDIVNSDENNAKSPQTILQTKRQSLIKMSSDEMDVVTPSVSSEDLTSSNLIHSGEFHDAVLPTTVSRNDTSVVSGE